MGVTFFITQNAAKSFSRSTRQRKNRALAGPVAVLPIESAITFQRGTAGCIAIATWEEKRSC
ncbi:MAG TPA: hypothetical protein VFE89_01665, partial [Beijerinckiaceae bacterium]|nr:hypothetical protein [Beijerinckiaceae bacterium]